MASSPVLSAAVATGEAFLSRQPVLPQPGRSSSPDARHSIPAGLWARRIRNRGNGGWASSARAAGRQGTAADQDEEGGRTANRSRLELQAA